MKSAKKPGREIAKIECLFPYERDDKFFLRTTVWYFSFVSIVANVFNKIYVFFNHDSLSFNRFEIFIPRMVEIYSNSKRICKKKKERKREKLRWLWSGARWGRGEEKKRREERYPVPSIDNSTLSILYPTFAFLLKLVRLQRWEGGRGKTFLPAIAHRLTGNTSHRRGAAIPFAYPRATSRTTRDPNVNGIRSTPLSTRFPWRDAPIQGSTSSYLPVYTLFDSTPSPFFSIIVPIEPFQSSR